MGKGVFLGLVNVYMGSLANTFRPVYREKYRLSRTLFVFCLLITSLFYLTAATSTVGAATYYLDAVNGDDSNPGTEVQPWKTVSYAMATVSSGDTVIMSGGTYDGFIPAINWTGFDSWTIFQAADGETPIIPYLFFEGSNGRSLYLKFDNITIQPGREDGAQLTYIYCQNTSYLHLVDCNFIGNGYLESDFTRRGIFLNAQHAPISNITIDNCTFTGTGTGAGKGSRTAITGVCSDSVIKNCDIQYHGTGIAIASGAAGNMLIQNNHIYNCQDNGIVNTGGKGMQIINNRIHDIIKPDGWSCHNDGIQVNHVADVDDLVIRSNIIYNVMHQGFFLNPVSGTNWLIENNLLYNVPMPGQSSAVVTIAQVDGCTFRNNVVASHSSVVVRKNYPGGPMVMTSFHNNIVRGISFYEDGDDYGDVVIENEDYNIYVDCATWLMGSHQWGANTLQLTESQFEALFADYDNGNFQHASASSLGVGHCDPENYPTSDILGNSRDLSPDAGCYEYVSSDPNNDPVLQEIGSKSVNENSVLTFDVNATDPNGDTITYSTQNLPSGATFAGQTFSWTPGYDQAGSYDVTFIASDGTAQDSETITITVNNTNRAPVLDSIGDKSVYENSTLSFSISATDADSDTITYSATDLPTGAVFASQTFSWTPGYNQAGTHQVTFTASDSQAQDSETITITVNNTNRDPVLDSIGNKSVYTESSLSFTISATDADSDTITYSVAGLPSGATFASQSFSWTPGQSQTGSHQVTFTASDNQTQDSETITITVTADTSAPAVSDLSPTTDSIQTPLNTLITLHIVDAGKGVDANSVSIKVNDNIVYTGNTDDYSSGYGHCHRTGTKANYTFIYQADEMLDFDQMVGVTVNATDLAGNTMDQYSYSFKTEMRSFGENKQASSGSFNKGGAVTARNSTGDIWTVWHTGQTGSKDIYIGKLAAGADSFSDSVQITNNDADQCNPTIAIDSADKLYVAWQDSRNGEWDIYVSTSTDGTTWSTERKITDPNSDQTNPAMAIDSSNKAYIVWEDDRNSNKDIYIASSNNSFVSYATSQITSNASEQTTPAIAVDSDNTVYVIWTDARGATNDIYGAASNNSWTNVAIVNNAGNQSNPAIAAESAGSILHLLWVDDASGDNDIYYVASDGLPSIPLSGSSIIDDDSGADQLQPAIAVTGNTGNDLKVFACWKDQRDADTDLYFVQTNSNTGTNVFIGDDSTNADQSQPAIATDIYGHPYLVWTDSRNTNTDIYYAGSTFVESTVLASKQISTSSDITVGTVPAAIDEVDDVSVIVPAGAHSCDIKITISRVKNQQKLTLECFSLPYEFGPSGINFTEPVTITIPYEVSGAGNSTSAYWYNPLTGTLSQEGITDVENIVISSTLHALRFRTTHFTQFLVGGGIVAAAGGGGGGGGGCSISPNSQGGIAEFILPYIALSVAMTILKLRDRRKKTRKITESKC